MRLWGGFENAISDGGIRPCADGNPADQGQEKERTQLLVFMHRTVMLQSTGKGMVLGFVLKLRMEVSPWEFI